MSGKRGNGRPIWGLAFIVAGVVELAGVLPPDLNLPLAGAVGFLILGFVLLTVSG